MAIWATKELDSSSGRSLIDRRYFFRLAKDFKMSDTLKPGDKVEWNTSQGKTHGTVVKKQTTETHIKKHKVAASKDDPQFIVKSDNSGKNAAHKPEQLKKKS